MRHIHCFSSLILLYVSLSLLAACSPVRTIPPADKMHTYMANGEDLLHTHAPLFVIEYPEFDYNRIGTPSVNLDESGTTANVFIDTERATLFAEERHWQGSQGHYTNLIYRIHFSEIPLRLFPFHLGAGKNIGLFVIITLNQDQQPLLITTLHTCGCYLAFIPTSYLERDKYPEDLETHPQYIYGEYLPGILEFPENSSTAKISILLRDQTHRVKNIWLEPDANSNRYPSSVTRFTPLKPLNDLSKLSSSTGEYFSFFETSGTRKDYVRDSQKIWERLFISWWALDWRVGEDKRLGHNLEDGTVFYTSLKPWARQESDLRDFAKFLSYWGWRL